MLTSKSHPLRIAVVQPSPLHGRIGITLCPGKKDQEGGMGHWDRDLAADIAQIKKWGADLVLTLVEQHEMEDLQVTELGSAVQSHGMEWLHLPIIDGSIPTKDQWAKAGEYVRSLLRNNFDVLGSGPIKVIAEHLNG